MISQRPTPSESPRVLIAMPSGPMRERLVRLLQDRDLEVQGNSSPATWRHDLANARADVIVVRPEDLATDLPGDALIDRALARGDASEGPRPGLGEDLLGRTWKEVRASVLQAAEREYLHATLQRCKGIVGAAARHAGLSPRSLYDKMKQHGLRKEDYRVRRRARG